MDRLLRELAEKSKRMEIQLDTCRREKEQFISKYTYLTGCGDSESEAIYDEAELQGINTDSIINMLSIGYQHEDIQSIIKRDGAAVAIYAIATYGVKKFEKNKGSDTIGQTSVL